MKKLTAMVLAAAMVFTLSGCTDYGTDYAKEYKDFFEYTFDGNYTMEETEKDVQEDTWGNEVGYRKWDISYTDKNGKNHIADLYASSDDHEDTFGDKFDEVELLAFTTNEQNNICMLEFYDNVMKNYFGIPDLDEGITDGALSYSDNDEYAVFIWFSNAPSQFIGKKENHELLDKYLSDKHGIKISDTTVKSFMAEKENFCSLVITIKDNSRTQEISDKARQLFADFEKYCPNAVNYNFIINVSDGEFSTPLMRKKVINGETIYYEEDLENGLEEDENSSFIKEVAKANGYSYNG